MHPNLSEITLDETSFRSGELHAIRSDIMPSETRQWGCILSVKHGCEMLSELLVEVSDVICRDRDLCLKIGQELKLNAYNCRMTKTLAVNQLLEKFKV